MQATGVFEIVPTRNLIDASNSMELCVYCLSVAWFRAALAIIGFLYIRGRAEG